MIFKILLLSIALLTAIALPVTATARKIVPFDVAKANDLRVAQYPHINSHTDTPLT
jgi:hypothetical protein|tara:strand:- start:83 stop:250 length:168 start_codon:yes stop_codon:yes gene_type:complete